MKRDKLVSTALVFALALTLVMAFNAAPVVHAEYGPRTPNLLIHIYPVPDAEFAALDAGEIDVVDWPLLKDWVDLWRRGGVQMRDYSEMAWNELTFNHQNWPLGNRYVDKAQPPGPLHSFDPTQQRDLDALAMRKAIAYLNDKARYIFEILKGLGMWIFDPMPWCFYDWYSYPPIPPIYYYNKAAAQQLLFNAGFRDYDNDGWLEYATVRTELEQAVYTPHASPYDIFVKDATGFAPGQTIVVGLGTSREEEVIDGINMTVTPHNISLSAPLSKAHPWGDSVAQKNSIEELPPLIFYARADDPERGAYVGAAPLLKMELESVGILVDYRLEDYFGCYHGVMIGREPDGFHDFHLYTSRWIKTAPTIDHLRDLYSSAGIVEVPGEFAWNYGGFLVGDGVEGTADDDYDYELWSYKAKCTGDYAGTHAAVLKAEEIFHDFVGTLPWWSKVSIKAYRTGWTGFVNHMALGVDFSCSNHNTFLNAYNPADTTLDWGIWPMPIKLHRISSDLGCEENVIGLVYDKLVCHDPFDYAGVSQGWLAAAVEPGADNTYGTPADPSGYFDDVWAWTGTWAPGKMYMSFKIREGALFHDGTPVTPEDVRWTILFTRDCGPGIAFDYPSVMDVDHVDTWSNASGQGITVYENVESYWAFYWIGYTGVMNKKIWEKAEWGPDGINGTPDDWDYDFTTDTPGPNWDPLRVKAYHPWEEKRYNGVNYDLTLDGAGPWVYQNFVSGESVTLTAFTGYYKSQEEVEEYIGWSFHRLGNINFKGSFFETEYLEHGDPSLDQRLTVYDTSRTVRAWATIETYPYPDWWGIDYKLYLGEWKTVYNPDCNFNFKEETAAGLPHIVDIWDLDRCITNYGKQGE